MGHPHLHIKPNLHVCRRLHGSQIFKQNSIVLIHSCFIVFLWYWLLQLQEVGQLGWGFLGWSEWVLMSSGIFRGKEFLKRIELPWLVQDLLTFGDLGSLQLWGGGRWVGTSGGMEVSLDMCTCTCMHAHAQNTKISMLGYCSYVYHVYHVQHVCVCLCMLAWACLCTCVWGWCYPTWPPTTNPATPRVPPRISINWIKLEWIKIFWFCWKILNLWRLFYPWVGVWFGRWLCGWVGLWVESCEITKNVIKLDLIEIINFYLKIYHLWIHDNISQPWVGVWVNGWVSGWLHIKLAKVKQIVI